jgi:hypothetical protein
MTTSDHRHNERNNGHDNHTKDDEIDSGKELGVFFLNTNDLFFI